MLLKPKCLPGHVLSVVENLDDCANLKVRLEYRTNTVYLFL